MGNIVIEQEYIMIAYIQAYLLQYSFLHNLNLGILYLEYNIKMYNRTRIYYDLIYSVDMQTSFKIRHVI